MKKAWVSVLVVAAILGMLIIGCSKKKSIVLTPSDFGTATASATNVVVSTSTFTSTRTAVSTSTFTRTITPTRTITVTATDVPPGSSPTFTPTISLTPTITNTEVIAASATFTATEALSPTPTFTETVPPAAWPSGFIDDCEDTYAPNANNYNAAAPVLNVGGYWITYDDNSIKNHGTSYVWPMSQPWSTRKGFGLTPPFEMSAPGYSGSLYGANFAAHVTGYVTTNLITAPGETTGGYQYGFFGFGTQLTVTAGEPTCAEVDITPYTGIRFWVKGDGVLNGWSVKLPFSATNGNCDGTLTGTASSFTGDDEYKRNFTAPAAWTQVSIPFSSFTQEGWGVNVSIPDGRWWKGCSTLGVGTTPGWLATCSIADVKQHVKQIQFQTVGQTAATIYPNSREIWIDDIELYQ